MRCNHEKSKMFTERTFSNGTKHYCVQCQKCGSLVEHNGKKFIKFSDIPANKKIIAFNAELHKAGCAE